MTTTRDTVIYFINPQNNLTRELYKNYISNKHF